ncbi:Alpha/Beta hydrolase protein [Mycena latifolia]|nr:Alpha/Beta hydrolase protein [Mycena latifolia]
MIYYIFLATCIPLVSSAATNAAATTPRVSFQYATFQGVSDGNLTKFLGIPFSRPVARFEAPRPPTQLLGLQDATAFGPACPQQAIPAPFVFGNYSISEDFKAPVLVWIYGGIYPTVHRSQVVGGFEIGASPDTDVRPAVERSILVGEPVIIVTPNYRVSEIAAHEWVRDYISDFGGDPSKVVVGGASSGAISTSLLMLSNKLNTNTLFRGAFLESSSPVSTGSVADGQPFYDGLVAANNCTGYQATLACLRRVPFDSFMATVNRTNNLISFTSLSSIWRPRVDGEVIMQNLLVSVSKGAYSKIPLMTGDSDDEGTVFSFKNDNITTNIEFMGYTSSPSAFRAMMLMYLPLNPIFHIYLPKSTRVEIAQISNLYPEDPTKGSPFGTGSANAPTPEFKRLAAFQGDYTFLGPRRFFLEHASSRQDT